MRLTLSFSAASPTGPRFSAMVRAAPCNYEVPNVSKAPFFLSGGPWAWTAQSVDDH